MIDSAYIQRIMSYDETEVPDVAPFVAVAMLLTEAVIGTEGIDVDLLEAVTAYVACHLIATKDKQIQSEQVKSIQVSYQFKLGMGLALSHFGSMAMMLDTTGRLSQYNKRLVDGTAKIQFFWAAPEAT